MRACSRPRRKLARLRIGNATTTPPDPGGLYGCNLPGRPLRLAVLGDSAAAGYGADDAGRDVRRLPRDRVSPTSPRRPVFLKLGGRRRARMTSGSDAADPRGTGVAARRVRDHHRRQRRHPQGAALRVGPQPARRRRDVARARAPRSSSAPAPTSARSGRSRHRSARSPAVWSRRLAAAQTIARGRGRRSRGVARHDPRTGVRRGPGRHVRPGPVPSLSPPATRLRRRRCCPRSPRRSASMPTPTSRAASPCAARGVLRPGRGRGVTPPTTPARGLVCRRCGRRRGPQPLGPCCGTGVATRCPPRVGRRRPVR